MNIFYFVALSILNNHLVSFQLSLKKKREIEHLLSFQGNYFCLETGLGAAEIRHNALDFFQVILFQQDFLLMFCLKLFFQ